MQGQGERVTLAAFTRKNFSRAAKPSGFDHSCHKMRTKAPKRCLTSQRSPMQAAGVPSIRKRDCRAGEFPPQPAHGLIPVPDAGKGKRVEEEEEEETGDSIAVASPSAWWRRRRRTFRVDILAETRSDGRKRRRARHNAGLYSHAEFLRSAMERGFCSKGHC